MPPTPFLFALFTLPPVDPPSSDSFARLDDELATLAAGLRQPSTGPRIGGWIRTRFASSSDVDASAAPGRQDLGGFDLDSVRLVLSGKAAEHYGYTISMEAGDALVSDVAGPGVGLLDAYVSVALSDAIAVSVGRFSATTLWSTGIEDRRLLFLDRSFVGEALDGRDVGAEFSGSFDRLHWWATAQNGSDGQGNDLALSARLSYRVLGDALPSCEGCCDAGDLDHLTIGACWLDDSGLDDGSLLIGDVFFRKGGWSAIAEIADFGDDLRAGPTVNPASGIVVPGAAAATGAKTPWNATLAYLFAPNEWEAAARYQDLDDDDGTTMITVAVSRYFANHDVKWIAQYDTSDSDDPALEADTIALGLTVGF